MGKVTQFDEERGLGEISADDGSVISFHCTSIANRQRRIPEGARVTFATVAGHLGALEAVGVTVVTLERAKARVGRSAKRRLLPNRTERRRIRRLSMAASWPASLRRTAGRLFPENLVPENRCPENRCSMKQCPMRR